MIVSTDRFSRKELIHKKIVFTVGYFDVLQPSHVRFLTECKKQGDLLVVGMYSDKYIGSFGPGLKSAVNRQEYRAEMLDSLACVDMVTFIDGPDCSKAIRAIYPQAFCKSDKHRAMDIPEISLLRKIRCPVLFLPVAKEHTLMTLMARMSKAVTRGPIEDDL